jgi:hypothetical protein
LFPDKKAGPSQENQHVDEEEREFLEAMGQFLGVCYAVDWVDCPYICVNIFFV